jgi:methyl-galactoside transport system substrate-binding protein
MKKILMGMLILLLASCTQANHLLPLFIYDMSDPYMHDFEQKIKDMAMADIMVRSFDASNSQIIQNEQIDEWIKENEVLIINPVDRLSVFSIIEKAKKTNTKLIFFNREPLNSDLEDYEGAYYVGADAKQSAELQASLIIDLFTQSSNYDLNKDNKIQTIILKGEQGHQDAEARTEFVVSSLKASKFDIEVIEISVNNWNREQAYQSMLELIEFYGNSIELVISNNDAMALGAIDALVHLKVIEDLNKDLNIDRSVEPWIPVVGIDGLEEAVESIESGYLYGTIVNDSSSMAEKIMELAHHLMDVSSYPDIEAELIDGKYIWIDYQKLTLKVE